MGDFLPLVSTFLVKSKLVKEIKDFKHSSYIKYVKMKTNVNYNPNWFHLQILLLIFSPKNCKNLTFFQLFHLWVSKRVTTWGKNWRWSNWRLGQFTGIFCVILIGWSKIKLNPGDFEFLVIAPSERIGNSKNKICVIWELWSKIN